jgi:hypothetical protein
MFCVEGGIILRCSQYGDYLSSNGRMTDELERIWEEVAHQDTITPFAWDWEDH